MLWKKERCLSEALGRRQAVVLVRGTGVAAIQWHRIGDGVVAETEDEYTLSAWPCPSSGAWVWSCYWRADRRFGTYYKTGTAASEGEARAEAESAYAARSRSEKEW